MDTTVERHLRTVDLAKAVGLSVQQVRNYETSGFLPEARRGPNGYRLYSTRHLAALRTARHMIEGYSWRPALTIMQTYHRGDLDGALALIDRRHADLDRQRTRVERLLTALRAGAGARPPLGRPLAPDGARIGEAAKQVGVRVSAVRYWEARGLVQPTRERGSRYRRYDDRQLRRLQVVALLRAADYDFETIRVVLEEMAAGTPERALEVVERRREELFRASRTGIAATAAFWAYASADGDL